MEGYLPATAIAGLDSFDKGRRDAAWVTVNEALNAARNAAALETSALKSRPHPASDLSRRRSAQHAAGHPTRQLADVRTRVASVRVTKEHRPGPEDPVGSVLYCVSTFRVTSDHIGC